MISTETSIALYLTYCIVQSILMMRFHPSLRKQYKKIKMEHMFYMCFIFAPILSVLMLYDGCVSILKQITQWDKDE